VEAEEDEIRRSVVVPSRIPPTCSAGPAANRLRP